MTSVEKNKEKTNIIQTHLLYFSHLQIMAREGDS